MKIAIKTLIYVAIGLVPAIPALAGQTRIVCVLDMEDASGEAKEDVGYFTDSIYAAATELPPKRFSVLSREKLQAILRSREAKSGQGASAVGALVGADLVFSSEFRRIEGSMEVTLKLQEVGSGRLIGLERVDAKNKSEMGKLIRDSAGRLFQRLPQSERPDDQGSPATVVQPEAPPAQFSSDNALLRFRSSPTKAKVFVNGYEVCEETPCAYRIEPGDHEITMKAKYYRRRSEVVSLSEGMEITWKMEPQKYSYLGMNDTNDGCFLLTLGRSPHDSSEYKTFSLIDGFEFSNLHSIVDIGFGGGIFSYRTTPRGKNWSILSFGPVVRAGRLILQSQLHLLSFRSESKEHSQGWLPGFTLRLILPLLTDREVNDWAYLMPAPVAGLDIWFDDDLNHDQTTFWVGMSWLGDIDFF
jgi:hypothetical protein